MIRVTLERPDAELAAHWEQIAPFATNVFMHPAALKAASDTLLAMITVLLAWDTAVEPNKLVGWWALQGRHLLLWSYFESLPFDYAFLSTPVVVPDRAAEVIPAFLAAIAREASAPTTIRVRDLDASGPVADSLRALDLPRTMLQSDQRPVATREIGIKRSGATRKKLRQDWNRLAASGTLEAVNVRDPSGIGAALEAFLEMEAAGWKGDRGTALLSDPTGAAFARRLIADMSALGQASVALLELDGRAIAAQVLLYSGRTAYTWKTSYDPKRATHSPGMLLVDWISTELLDTKAVDAINSCAVGDSFMASLLSGRKPMANMVISARPGLSPSYLVVAGYFRMHQLAKKLRNRLIRGRRQKKPAPASPA